MDEAFFNLCRNWPVYKAERSSVCRFAAPAEQLFFTELSTLNDQGILIKGMIRDRS